MLTISDRTRKYYSKKIKEMPRDAGSSKDFRIRRMCNRLADEFDEVWLRYERGEVTFGAWEKSLNKWLQAEVI